MINPERAPEAAAGARTRSATSSSCAPRARSSARAPEAVNPKLPTGEVELQVDALEIVSRSTPLPFQLDEEGVDETLRLRYRWLDLRRPRMQRNIAPAGAAWSRRSAARWRRDGFLDIQTPILFKPTPEGARDFVVPSRLQQGRFFALPQSPQILKQLLVIAGFDRYYQIAICFRDEDLRADRVQEITQLDVEMAFPDQEFLFALMERMCAAVWREGIGVELATPFPRMTLRGGDRRATARDKPDLRFGLEIEDATEVTRGSEFGVFANAPAVRFLRVPQAFSRAELDRLEEFAKEWGAKGLAYLVYDEDGEVRSPIAKFLSEDELAALPLRARLDRALRRRRAGDGRARARRAPPPPRARARADRRGGLAVRLGHRLPDVRVGRGRRTAGRPCTIRSRARHPASESALDDRPGRGDGARVRPRRATASSSAAARSGSTSRSSRRRSSRRCSSAPEEQRRKFGFLLDALAMGAPPHGGIAFGIDRMLMALGREPNLRDMIAFPKNQAGVDPMSGAPSEVEEEQLEELGIQLRAQPE